jgi:putative aldouronate transport system substrate-binding protein
VNQQVAATAPAAKAAAASVLPTYLPPTNVAQADYKSPDPRRVDAYEHYPKPFKSWNKEAPGTGKRVDVFVANYYATPPTPYESNLTWQEVNRQLNADVRMNEFPGADYRTRMATLLAGGDFPDMIHIFFGVGYAPNLVDFVEASAADLTPYLAGDAIKDYPNLAAIPTYTWKNSLSALDGRLLQWPTHRYLPGLYFLSKNATIYDAEIGKDYVPKDGDDFKKVLQQLTRPQDNRWGYGVSAVTPNNVGLPMMAALFGAPNTWGMVDGKLVRDRETEQYKAAVGYLRDLWQMGVVFPDVASAPPTLQTFVGQKFVMGMTGFGNPLNDLWRLGLQANPAQQFDLVDLFPGVAGTQPYAYLTGGSLSTTVLKKAPPDRIQELLRIVDFIASPFGSEESKLLLFGVEGRDHTLNATGDPILNQTGTMDALYVSWRYIAQYPWVHYSPDTPGFAKRMFDLEQQFVDKGKEDVTNGVYSKTNFASVGTTSNQTFLDAMNDIVFGRRGMSDYDQLVADWRATAGDQIRAEYTEALAAASK